MKLTIDQLKNYLGTGLEILDDEEVFELTGLKGEHAFFKSLKGFESRKFYKIQPLMYRLSDLDKFIPELGFVPLEQLTPYAKTRFTFVRDCGEDLRDWTFQDMQKLFQWHFWPFGDEYFEAGLVIDKLLYNPTTN